MQEGSEHRTANYSTFFVENESSNYRLTVTGYSGDAGGEEHYLKIIWYNHGDRIYYLSEMPEPVLLKSAR